jgi:hypothetical protein
VGADDEVLLDRIGRPPRPASTVRSGWPAAFVEFVRAHHDGHVTVPAGVARSWCGAGGWRYRVTDEVVRTATGRPPLSVAADRIGHTAMRAAGLLSALARAGRPVDGPAPEWSSRCIRPRRFGSGGCPATGTKERRTGPARRPRRWAWPSGPAGSTSGRTRRCAAGPTTPWTRWWLRSPHGVPRSGRPPSRGDQRRAANTEGWIALPTIALEDAAMSPVSGGQQPVEVVGEDVQRRRPVALAAEHAGPEAVGEREQCRRLGGRVPAGIHVAGLLRGAQMLCEKPLQRVGIGRAVPCREIRLIEDQQ